MTRGIRKGLTPDLVLRAAFRIVDADGAEALTMRRLAQELGVAAMAIYNHFADRDAILDAIADEVFTPAQDGALSGRGQNASPSATRASRGTRADGRGVRQAKARLRQLVMGVSAVAREHPHVYRLAITRRNKPESAFRLATEAMELFRGAGLSRADAAAAYHVFALMLQGFPFWRQAMDEHSCQKLASSVSDRASATALADWRAIHHGPADQHFERAVDVVLDGLLDCHL